MGRLLSVKGSDCAIFHIFPGTFWGAGQNFRDYFFIWTFFLQWLVRLGWNLARTFPQHICTFSSHFFNHQWISIFIGGLCLSTTVAVRKFHRMTQSSPPSLISASVVVQARSPFHQKKGRLHIYLLEFEVYVRKCVYRPEFHKKVPIILAC